MLKEHARNWHEHAVATCTGTGGSLAGKNKLTEGDTLYGRPRFTQCFTWSLTCSKPVLLTRVKGERGAPDLEWEHDCYYDKCSYASFHAVFELASARGVRLPPLAVDVTHRARADFVDDL
jgi:hypothetical protein